MSSNFRYQSFVAVSGNLGGKVPVFDDVLSSHEQKIYCTTSLDENCVDFEFQTNRNFYDNLRQTYIFLKLNFIMGRGYETYITKEVKKEPKEQSKTDVETKKEQDAPVFVVTHVNKFLHSIFSIVEAFMNNQQNYNSNRLYLTFPTTSGKPFLNAKEFITGKGTTMKKCLMKLWKRLCLNLFFLRRMKMFTRPDGIMLYGKLGIDFFSISELLYPNIKNSFG